MKFSQLDVIGLERGILSNRKEVEGARMWGRFLNAILYPRNPKHTFTFYTPSYLYIRSLSFCEDVESEIDDNFDAAQLAKILYIDFLEYVKRSNNIHDIYRRLLARDLSPTIIKPYYSDNSYSGVLFEEMRGFEKVSVQLPHKLALKGEFLLRDMLEIYPDHTFTLENILEIVYCDFVDDYRKGLIKNPIDKIIYYL